uniref:Uncharacterized protein n=1 Tax=Rhizophora mucronata TaxID=61149 RepID=A0A2P2NHE0_RHIMU
MAVGCSLKFHYSSPHIFLSLVVETLLSICLSIQPSFCIPTFCVGS